MADNTDIEWTDATWNPITGCSIVSPGCTNCYAMKLAGTRLKNHDSRKGLTREVNGKHVWTGEVRFNAQWLDQPLRWSKPRMIFVCAHGDLFAEGVPDEWLDQIFAVMALAPQHTFQVLTKRPERMREYVKTLPARSGAVGKWAAWHWGAQDPDLLYDQVAYAVFSSLPNVWLGVSVEDQRRADERIPILLDTPAAIRWVSAEPLLGPVDISRWTATAHVTCKACRKAFWLHNAEPCHHKEEGDGWTLACPHCGGCRCKPAWSEMDARCRTVMEPPQGWVDRKIGRFTKVHPTIQIKSGLDWVVAGGESGPMHPDWARGLRDQCASAGVPFMFKQWGEWSEACSDVREADGSHIEVAPDSDEGEALYDPATDRLIALDGRLFTPETLPNDTPARLVERVGKRRAGRLLDGIEHNGYPEVAHG